jgi:hypothetical protein
MIGIVHTCLESFVALAPATLASCLVAGGSVVRGVAHRGSVAPDQP